MARLPQLISPRNSRYQKEHNHTATELRLHSGPEERYPTRENNQRGTGASTQKCKNINPNMQKHQPKNAKTSTRKDKSTPVYPLETRKNAA